MIQVNPNLLRIEADNGHSVQFGYTPGFIVGRIDDLSAVSVSISTTQAVGQIGATVHGQSVQGKRIAISGEIICTDESIVLDAEMDGKRKQLLYTIVPQVGVKLIYNDVWETAGVVTESPSFRVVGVGVLAYRFELFIPNPYWSFVQGTSTLVAGLEATFYFPRNFGMPYSFGKRLDSATVDVANEGNVPVEMRVIFRALSTLRDPYIHNTLTGERIGFNNLEMQPRDVLTLDLTTRPVTAVLQRGEEIISVIGRLNTPFTRIDLQPGSNVLAGGAGVNPGGVHVEIEKRIMFTAPC